MMEDTKYDESRQQSIPIDIPKSEVESVVEEACRRYQHRYNTPELSSGWTVQNGIFELIEPYLDREQLSDYLQFSKLLQSEPSHDKDINDGPPDFARFKNLSARTALSLLDRLPARALADRQNEAPLLLDFLKACLRNPNELTLFGYYVGPQRGDERISVEGMIYHRHADLEIKRFHDEECSCDQLWDYIVEDCGWTESVIATPDELTEVTSDHPQGVGWRLWWD